MVHVETSNLRIWYVGWSRKYSQSYNLEIVNDGYSIMKVNY